MSFRKKNGHIRSIQKRITVIYVLVITVLISVLGSMTYFMFQKVLADRVVTDHEHLLKQSEENIDLLVNNVNYAFVYMSADQYTAEILNHHDLSIVSAYNYIRLLKQQFTNFVDLPATDLNSVYRAYLFLNPQEPLSCWLPPYRNSGQQMVASGVYNTDTVRNQAWYQKAAATNGQLIFSVQKDSHGKKQLYIAKLISNPYIYSDSLGVALVVISPDAFAQQLQMSQYTEPTRILLTDNQNTVIYSNAAENANLPNDTDIIHAVQQNKINSSCKTEKINGEPYIVSCNQLQWGWYMISAVPYSNLTSSLNPVLYLIILILAMFILLGAFFTALAAKKISRPIISLSRAMEHLDVEKGPCLDDSKLPNDEIGRLYSSFENMVLRIRNLIADIRESHKKQLEAEYEALQAQINPHFLYNTLNSINWMVIMRKEYDISNAVSALSGIMQYSISRKGNKATIADELQHVEKFLVIERLHYGDKIDYCRNVSQDCMNCIVPKIILQPLVENAIVHGIACREGKGSIEIQGRVQDGILIVQIIDNGSGADTDLINRQLENGDLIPAKEHGIGVVNVHNRIKMMFGDSYGLHYATNALGGVTVTITLTAIQNPDNQNTKTVMQDLSAKS